MTTRSGEPADEGFWRRPPAPPRSAETGEPPGGGTPSGGPAYAGPPPNTPPPAGWRPPVHVQPPPPRRLPPQEIEALEAAERSSRTLTYGVGMLATAVLLVVMCLLCSRLLF